ncbi:MAG: peptidylprolyl isomerase [Patescibacteria group bacterium]|jgi:hypothetical protein
MTEIHPDHEAVRAEIAEAKLPDPEHHDLKKLPPPHIHWLRRIAIWLGGLVVLLILVFAVGYLRFSWQNKILLWPAKVLPYPVSIVGGEWLSYYDYQADVPNITQYVERNSPPDAEVTRNMSLDVYSRKIILNKMIGEEIINKIGLAKKLTVTQADIDKTYQNYVTQAGSTEAEISDTIKTLYNWSVDEFKQKLISSQVIQEKLAESYFAEVKNQVEQLRTEILKDPKTFGEVAKTQSDDTSAAKGGLIEPMNTAALKTAYSDSAAQIESLKVGEISNVLETSRGYEIVYLEKKEAAKKTADGNMFTLRVISKMPDYNTWIQDLVNAEIKKSRIIVFEPRFRWEADCGILTKAEPSCKTTASN